MVLAVTRFAHHLLSGDHASRPSAASVPQGTLYACSTHGLIYQSDGISIWPTWLTVVAGGAYHHIQSVPATTWTINHMLGRHPSVSVLDSGGSQVEVAVSHTSVNQVVLTLAYAVSGTADCT